MAEGGCMCGAVRYEVAAEPLFTAICHCRQCQRQTGSAYSLVTAFPAGSLTLRGTTATFDDIGESGGKVAKQFCPGCGSPMISTLAVLPEIVIVKSGTLDDPGSLVPTIEVFCDSALAFLPTVAGATRFARSNIGIDG